MKKLFMLAAVFALVAGCAAPNQKEQKAAAAQEAAPINCSTAEGDLRMLNSEKASTSAKIEAGITSIVPIGLVAHAAGGSEGATFHVATGEYNKMIDKKIGEIKAQCGIK